MTLLQEKKDIFKLSVKRLYLRSINRAMKKQGDGSLFDLTRWYYTRYQQRNLYTKSSQSKK